MTINKYWPIAGIYFFVNTIALPFGLTYTTLLAPLFYVWILLTRGRDILLPFLLIFLPFVIAHFSFADVDRDVYLLSLANLLLVYFFCQAVYTFLKISTDREKILTRILQVNFVLCLIAIPVYFTPGYELLWDEQILRNGVGQLRRLKMFTYEPSYYALLFTPVFCFFLLQYLFRQNRIPGVALLLMLFVPFILSASVGVVASLIIAGFITGMVHFRKLFSKRRILNATINTGFAAGSILILTFFWFRENPLFTRLANILTGEDSSAKGRTADAFILAQKMLGDDNRVWGIGLGQIKIAGNDLIRDYYLYNMDVVVTIPNAMAETLAIFGWAGLVLRLLAELVLFYVTKVWSNYYRLLLFLFMFIYQ